VPQLQPQQPYKAKEANLLAKAMPKQPAASAASSSSRSSGNNQKATATRPPWERQQQQQREQEQQQAAAEGGLTTLAQSPTSKKENLCEMRFLNTTHNFISNCLLEGLGGG
jgi:hypothetical protein